MFQLREIWSSNGFPNEEFGVNSSCCFKFDGNSCISIGSYEGILRFYFPSKADKGLPHTEILLKDPILQLSYGNFLVSNKEFLAVLQPKQLVLYELSLKEKSMNITEFQSFFLSHSPFCFISSSLESLSSIPSIIIESIDGYLTVLGNSGTVSYRIPGFFLPGPFMYIPLLESFIMASSDFRVSCYRKNILFSDQSNNCSPDWSYVFGEQILSLSNWKTSVKFVSSSTFDIAIIGERTLCVLTESGKIKTIMKTNGNVMSSHSYSSSPDPSKQCNNLLVGTTNKSVSIYVNFQKVWQFALPFVPIMLNIIDIDPNNGLICGISEKGSLLVGYLGTHDSQDLHLPSLPEVSAEKLSEHLTRTNERIEKMPTSDHVNVFINSSKASPNKLELVLQPNNSKVHDVMCYFDFPLSILPVSPIEVETLSMEESVYHIDIIPSGMVSSITQACINVVFSLEDDQMISKTIYFDIPYEFFIKRVEPRVKCGISYILYTKGTFLSLKSIFPNFVLPESHSLSLVLINGELVSISGDKKNNRYRVESDHFEYIGFALNILYNAFAKQPNSSLLMKDLPDFSPFFSIIEQHHSIRKQVKDTQKKIHSSVSELESVQKALIVRYESATPEPLEDLNSLFVVASQSIKEDSKRVIELQKELSLLDGRLEASIINFLYFFAMRFDMTEDEFSFLKINIPTRIVNCTPGWEECFYAGTANIIESLTKTKQRASYGSEIEFITNVEVLKDQIAFLIDAYSHKSPQKK